MNIRLMRSNDDNAMFPFYVGPANNFPDIFDALTVDYYAPDTTIVFEYPEESHVIINSNGECLFANIHDFMNKHQLPLKNFTYVTSNFKLAESYSLWKNENKLSGDINIVVETPHWTKLCFQWDSDHKHLIDEQVPLLHTEHRPYKYVNLNNMPWLHRVELMNYLHRSNLMEGSLNSFHNAHDNLDPEISVPLHADHLPANSHYSNQNHLYKNTYFSIITESVFDRSAHLNDSAIQPWESWHREGALTEKTYKAFFYRHPFVMVGAQGTLAYARSLGFKTFDGFIDESYDEIHDPKERMIAIQREIHKLCSMPLSRLHDWHHSMHEVYEHNQSILLHWKSLIPSWQIPG